jgi:hypothetical protein
MGNGKRTSSTLLILFCLISRVGGASVIVRPVGSSLYYDIVVEGIEYKPEVVEGVTLERPILKGIPLQYEGVLAEDGKPEVPLIRFYVDGEGKIDIRADEPTVRGLNLSHPLLPHLSPVEKIKGARRHLPSLNTSQDFLVGDVPYDIKTVGHRSGVLRRLVTLYPIQWNGSKKTEKWIKKFQVRAPRLLPHKKTLGTYVFIVDFKMAQSQQLLRLMRYRQHQGFSVRKLVAEGNLSTPGGIRRALQGLRADTRHPELQYVLLVGDHPAVLGFPDGQVKGVTDHYYRALDDYSRDINTPDVAVGRLSARNENELKIMVDKILRHESSHATGAEDWKKRALLIATDDQDFWQISESVHEWTRTNVLVPAGYLVEPLYAVSKKVTGADVLNSLKRGSGLVVYSGHGEEYEWETPKITFSDLQALQGNEALPFVFSHACDTGRFTRDESFSEAWQRNPGGGVFFWGSMDLTFWDEDAVIQKSWMTAVYNLKKRTIAELTDYALSELWRYYGGKEKSDYFWETYVTLGDPALRFKE